MARDWDLRICRWTRGMVASWTIVAAGLTVIPGAPLGAQGANVTGLVLDEGTRVPLAGARVALAGRRIATVVTDNRGRFSIRADTAGPHVLRITLVGYQLQEISVVREAGLVEVEVLLRRAPLNLDKVVVTGSTGPGRVREAGHEVAQIEPAQLPEPAASFDNLMSAKVPGLVVLQSSGVAGSASSLRLRGMSSITLSNQPLVYVDGIRVRSDAYPRNVPPNGDFRRGVNDVSSPLNDIDPADVDRVEIVKGPAATAMYGTEAAAGVINVITRRGDQGRTLWKSQLQVGFDRVQAFGVPGEEYLRLDPWLRIAKRLAYTLSAAGGAGARYYVSGSAARNEGVLPNDLESRLAVRANFDFDLSSRLQIAWNSAYSHGELNNTPAGANGQGLTMNAFRGPANFTGVPGKESIDRVLSWDIISGFDHLTAGATARYTASATQTHTLTLGLERAEDEMRSLRPNGFVFAPQGILYEERWISLTGTVDYLGRTEFRVNEALNLGLSWGAQSVSTDVGSLGGYAEGLPAAGIPIVSGGATTQAFQTKSYGVNTGVFSQLLLGVRDRAFLTAGFRLDGNSAFGSDFGLQPYPRIGFSYVLIDDAEARGRISGLRLRTAYGQAGRAPRIFDAQRTWIQVGYAGEPAYLPSIIGNSKLGPERSAEFEVGGEAAFFGGRLSTTLTSYSRTTRGALLPVLQAPSLGFLTSQITNVGRTHSSGIEAGITGVVLSRANVGLDAGLSIATHHSRVLSLGGAPAFRIGLGWIEEGQPIPLVRGVLITNPDEVADPILQTNHVFGPNVPTRTLVGRSTLRFGRGLELSARAEHVGGHFVWDRASNHLARTGVWPPCNAAYELVGQNRSSELTAWQRTWCIPSAAPSEGPVYPADFLRLRALTVVLPFPARWMGSSDASFSLSIRNVLLWKRREFLVFDPETGGQDGMNAFDRSVELTVPPAAGLTAAVRATF